MKTEKFLDELSNLIENSGTVPFTTKRMIEEDELERIIYSIKQSLPLELEESQRIVRDRDKFLEDAQRQADTLIAQAKEYIAKIVSEHELVKAAQEEATRIITEANKSNDELKASSITYAADVMKYVEGNLEKALASVRQSRASLQQDDNK